MGITYGVKALTIVSTIFGVLTLITCCWTFGSMIAFRPHVEMSDGNETEVISESTNPDIPQLWAQLSHSSERFRMVMYTSLFVAIFFILTQIISSLVIFLRKNTKIWSISKYFVGIHFGVFIGLLCCLLIPLSEEGKRQQGFKTFNDFIMDEFASFGENGIKYIVQEFHAYYFVLGLNISVIFFCMIIACCLLRCETHRPYDSV